MNQGKKILMLATGMAIAVAASAGNKIVETNAAAAPFTGTIAGRITDAQKNTLPGATVMIEKLNTGVSSDANGYFKLTNLKPGKYTVKISYVGYNPVEKTIEVTNATTKETNIVLNEGVELQGIEVDGAFHGHRKAIQMQKEQMGITNVVSADQVGKFPDSNIGDALKRINGINVQYDQGEARFGQVRGTSADLTSVTVNGNRLPSAEGGTRNVQLDLIPADMVQMIEVNKVVTSDMDGDAIGGAINLVTKNTPYKRVLNFTAGNGYTWVSGKPQWNLGATWGDRFFNNKLGVMAAASYQYAPGGSDNTEFEYTLDDNKNVILKEGQVRQYYVTRQRQSYSLALDYQFNALNKIYFKGIYNRRHDWENRYRVSYKKLDSAAKKQNVVIQTKAGSDDQKNARLELQQTMDFTLGGEHTIGNLSTDWAMSYSRATEDRPNERYAAIKLTGNDWSASFEDVGGRHPYSSLAIPSFDDSGWKMSELTNSNQNIKENEYKARLNFTLPISKGDFGSTLKFGAKYTRKDKEKVMSKFSYDSDVISDWKNNLTSQIRSGFMPGSTYPIGQQFISINYLGSIDFSKYKGTEVYEEEAGNYNATEQIMAEYLRWDQKLGRNLSAVIGLRVESTFLKTHGYNYQIDEKDNESLTPTGDFTHNYTNLLPSLLLKYKANDDWNIRASITKTISRPKYTAMIANKSYNLSDLTATIGDPNINPTRSWNADLSTDYYFKSIGLVSLGLFYKNIKDVNVATTGYYSGSEICLAGNTDVFTVTQDMNAYDASIFGVEVAYQRDFGFISPALKCLGFYGNYTYTHSTTRNYNPYLGIKDGDDVSMVGSPAHSANASLNFEKNGWQARLSYNFASSFIDEMNTGDRALDRYYDSVGYLDFNASYTWGKKTKWTIYADATNLLNQPLRYYQGTKDRTMQVEYYGVKVNCGVKVNL